MLNQSDYNFRNPDARQSGFNEPHLNNEEPVKNA